MSVQVSLKWLLRRYKSLWSLDGCSASDTLSKVWVHWSGLAFKRCWLYSPIWCILLKMHCIVLTENKCLPRYVYFCCASVCVLRLQHPLWGGRNCCAAMAAWRKLSWLCQLNLSVVTVGLSPSPWGHGFFHGYSGQDGLLSSHSLASCLMRGKQTYQKFLCWTWSFVVWFYHLLYREKPSPCEDTKFRTICILK